MHLTRLTNLLKIDFHGQFKKETTCKLRTLARKSVDSPDSTLSFQVVNIIGQIKQGSLKSRIFTGFFVGNGTDSQFED